MAAKRAALAAMLCAAAAWTGRTALAQVVFEDNFDGAALAPHWVTPPASHWDYDVSGGMLNVHRLNFPSHPKSSNNFASITTPVAPTLSGDFLATMRIVWEPDTVPLIQIALAGVTNTIARMEYQLFSISFFTPAGSAQTAPSPGAGTHELRIQRVTDEVRFFANNQLLGVLPDVVGGPVTRITVNFRSGYPVPPGGPVHLDAIRLVPAPAAVIALSLVLATPSRTRR